MIREILPFVDMVLVMTVNPGFGGQSFIRHTLGKIRTIAEMIQAGGWNVTIEVDGGISPQTAPSVVEHGASVLVAGTSVFRAPEGIPAAIRALRRAATDAVQ